MKKRHFQEVQLHTHELKLLVFGVTLALCFQLCLNIAKIVMIVVYGVLIL